MEHLLGFNGCFFLERETLFLKLNWWIMYCLEADSRSLFPSHLEHLLIESDICAKMIYILWAIFLMGFWHCPLV